MLGTLHVLTGPTAVGKTEWALRWAEAREAEIISCDSLLFYRGMDIGTAKPTRLEQARAPHHLIDICAVSEPLNVIDYVKRATDAARGIASRGRPILVVGGSGFYLRCFFAAVGDNIAIPAELRRELTLRLEQEGLKALVDELRALNPAGLGSLDSENPRRVVRALERCRVSGKTLAESSADFAAMPGPFSDWKVQLTRLETDPALLSVRIEQRVHAMIEQGLVQEVEALRQAGLETNPSASRAIGYRETLAMLRGDLPANKLAAEIIQNTRQLVKKQRTWFRTQLPAHRVVSIAEASVDTLFA